jgi:hypothetical protein
VLASKAAENYTLAASLAHQALSELARTPDLEAGDYSGTFEEPNTDFDWQADVLAQNADGLLPVRVTVLWGPDAHRNQFELRTYLSASDASTSTETSGGFSSGGPS